MFVLEDSMPCVLERNQINVLPNQSLSLSKHIPVQRLVEIGRHLTINITGTSLPLNADHDLNLAVRRFPLLCPNVALVPLIWHVKITVDLLWPTSSRNLKTNKLISGYSLQIIVFDSLEHQQSSLLWSLIKQHWRYLKSYFANHHKSVWSSEQQRKELQWIDSIKVRDQDGNKKSRYKQTWCETVIGVFFFWKGSALSTSCIISCMQ